MINSKYVKHIVKKDIGITITNNKGRSIRKDNIRIKACMEQFFLLTFSYRIATWQLIDFIRNMDIYQNTSFLYNVNDPLQQQQSSQDALFYEAGELKKNNQNNINKGDP